MQNHAQQLKTYFVSHGRIVKKHKISLEVSFDRRQTKDPMMMVTMTMMMTT